jgi:hypothetical protein
MTDLKSLIPEDILTVLDLGRDGLEKVKTAADGSDRLGALSALLDHYRATYPQAVTTGLPETIALADNVVNHTFQRTPYEPVN